MRIGAGLLPAAGLVLGIAAAGLLIVVLCVGAYHCRRAAGGCGGGVRRVVAMGEVLSGKRPRWPPRCCSRRYRRSFC